VAPTDNHPQSRSIERLRSELIALGPWHHDIRVTPELSTGIWKEYSTNETRSRSFGGMSIFRPADAVHEIIQSLFGSSGLEGRSVLDCGCNAGGFAFAARELGASQVVGFDAREHWLRQAEWLLKNRSPYPSDRIVFRTAELLEVPSLSLGQFDVTFFMGMFYHLADPAGGLKLIANMTRELLIVGTATRNFYPKDCLALYEEDPVHHLSGLETVNWLPTGPDIIVKLLRWAGFACTRVRLQQTRVYGQPENIGHLEILAAREASAFAHYDRVSKQTPEVSRQKRFGWWLWPA
jgi:tRNA (mo5U34)-methyltransferase